MKTEELMHKWHDLKDKAMNYWNSLEFTKEHRDETEAMQARKGGEREPLFDDFDSGEEASHVKTEKKEEHPVDQTAGSE